MVIIENLSLNWKNKRISVELKIINYLKKKRPILLIATLFLYLLYATLIKSRNDQRLTTS
jgi:hypothetical protein